MAKRKMDLRDYWDEVGTDVMLKIIKSCGSTLQHFRAMRYGLKKPSEDRANEIIAAARKFSPGWEPDFEKLMAGVQREEHAVPKRTLKIMPSKTFLSSNQARK
jgi:hypothetical protein